VGLISPFPNALGKGLGDGGCSQNIIPPVSPYNKYLVRLFSQYPLNRSLVEAAASIISPNGLLRR
jgi:hypothetical protein